VRQRDFPSAFVAQWKLCALTAEVFRLKGIRVVGIPANGFRGFPFVVNEPPIDLTVWPEDSSYLVLQSEIFTEAAISESLELCRRAGLAWIIGEVTEIIFEHLEQQRSFLVLQTLYQQVQLAFRELSITQSVQIGFARILVTGRAAEKVGFTEAVHTYTRFRIVNAARTDKRAGYTEFVAHYCKPLIGADDGEPLLDAEKGSVLQMMDVKRDREQLARLNATRFVKDVHGVDRGWDDPIIQRYVFTTESRSRGARPSPRTRRCRSS
jgi:hypothetical protein